ncbi:unnamed protein product [Didymodactylos carnosus]|nr:unnamed protein product [Didymodactylos carnosus]CAF3982285.1 unnamed protein product [Didymodactylos carnosus]
MLHGCVSLIKGFYLIIFVICSAIIAGPILCATHFTIKINTGSASVSGYHLNSGFTSCGILISLTAGLVDVVIYSMSFHSSLQAAISYANNQPVGAQEFYNRTNADIAEYHKELVRLVALEKNLLNPLSDVALLSYEVQDSVKDIHDLFKLFMEHNDSADMDSKLKQSAGIKLNNFLEKQKKNKEEVDAIKQDIDSLNNELKSANDRLSVTNSNTRKIKQPLPMKTSAFYFIDASTSNLRQLSQCHLFVLTVSFMIFIHLTGMSILQYLGLKDTKWIPSLMMMALLIIGQSMALLFYTQITHAFKPMSPLYLYAIVFISRSIMGIKHYMEHVN